jgi:hypothetical protein
MLYCMAAADEAVVVEGEAAEVVQVAAAPE